MTPIGQKAVLDQIRKVLPGLVRRGISSRRIMSALRGAGLHLRTTDFLYEIREASGVWKAEQWARAAPTTEVFKRGWMREEDLGYPAKYRVFWETEMYDEQTGETWMGKKSMYTDDWLTPEEWEEQFWEQFREIYQEEGIIITKMTLVNVRHNIGEPH